VFLDHLLGELPDFFRLSLLLGQFRQLDFIAAARQHHGGQFLIAARGLSISSRPGWIAETWSWLASARRRFAGAGGGFARNLGQRQARGDDERACSNPSRSSLHDRHSSVSGERTETRRRSACGPIGRQTKGRREHSQ
jgi:hypothetical protein